MLKQIQMTTQRKEFQEYLRLPPTVLHRVRLASAAAVEAARKSPVKHYGG